MMSRRLQPLVGRALACSKALHSGRFHVHAGTTRDIFRMHLPSSPVPGTSQLFISQIRPLSSSAEPSEYTSVPEVFDRIKSIVDSSMVSKVKTSYYFEIEGEGSYFLNLKSGDGGVIEGEAPEKPDVTFKMNSENCLNVFNRKLAPASAFMTGKVKMTGDLTKAFTLEKVMKAARQAAEAKAKE